MEYGSERRKKTHREAQEKIVKLWLECSSWEEFKVKVSLSVPEARWRDLFACKLYWFRKSHPIAYYFSWLAAIPVLIWLLSFAFFCLIYRVSEDSIAYSILATEITYVTIIFLHLGFVGDFMKELKWNEEGRPFEY